MTLSRIFLAFILAIMIHIIACYTVDIIRFYAQTKDDTKY